MNASTYVSIDRIERIKKLVSKFPSNNPRLIVKGIVFYPDKSPMTVNGQEPDTNTLEQAVNIIEDSYKMP